MSDKTQSDCPELSLWRSALASYLNDLLYWHTHRKPFAGDDSCFAVGAYADFHGNQCQLTRLCDFAQLDVEYVRQKVFITLQNTSQKHEKQAISL